jgi:hypothetical protein
MYGLTNCVQFSSTPNIPKNINIHYDDTQIHNTCNIKFLGIVIDSLDLGKNTSVKKQLID